LDIDAARLANTPHMQIGIPKEITPGETRVALVPETVAKVIKLGASVAIEHDAGAGAFYSDAAYVAAGATVTPDAASLFAASDLVVKIHRPTEREVDLFKEGCTLVAMLQSLTAPPELLMRLADRKVSAISLDAIPRISRAQALDVLSSMSTVAGYRAVIEAAALVPRFFPLLMTAAGTITPARVFIIGAGVAGLQAIATARRLGAIVEAYDTRPAVKEQVQSLGGQFVELALDDGAREDARGYATALSEDNERRVKELIAARTREADVVITTALVPGRRAPVLITAEMVRAMKPGSAIIDLAAEQGGNCELSTPGQDVVDHGVTIRAPLLVPARMPLHASQMFSRNVEALLKLLIKDGALHLDFEDQIVKDSCVTHGGEIVHEPTRARVMAGATA
jgi:NAD(P) transhydrogenase subunit alpha